MKSFTSCLSFLNYKSYTLKAKAMKRKIETLVAARVLDLLLMSNIAIRIFL